MSRKSRRFEWSGTFAERGQCYELRAEWTGGCIQPDSGPRPWFLLLRDAWAAFRILEKQFTSIGKYDDWFGVLDSETSFDQAKMVLTCCPYYSAFFVSIEGRRHTLCTYLRRRKQCAERTGGNHWYFAITFGIAPYSTGNCPQKKSASILYFVSKTSTTSQCTQSSVV